MVRKLPQRSPSTKVVVSGQKVARRMLHKEIKQLDRRYLQESKSFNHNVLLYLANNAHYRQRRSHEVSVLSKMFATDIEEAEVPSQTPTSVIPQQQQMEAEKSTKPAGDEDEEEEDENDNTDSDSSEKTGSNLTKSFVDYLQPNMFKRDRALSVSGDLLQKRGVDYRRRKSAPEVVITPALGNILESVAELNDETISIPEIQSRKSSQASIISMVSINSMGGDHALPHDRLSPSPFDQKNNLNTNASHFSNSSYKSSSASKGQGSRRSSVLSKYSGSQSRKGSTHSHRGSKPENVPTSEIASPIDDKRFTELISRLYIVSTDISQLTKKTLSRDQSIKSVRKASRVSGLS